MTIRAASLLRFFLISFGLFAAVLASASERSLEIGIFPRYSESRTQEMFGPLAEYLGERLRRPVRLVTVPDFPAFWEMVRRRRFDLVQYNQYHYLMAHKAFGHRAILKNEENGQDTIRSVIAVRADSPFESIQDLRGRKILFGGGRSAMMSYIVARHILQQAGLPPADYLASFSQTPAGAVREMFYGQGDAVGIGHTILEANDMPWNRLGIQRPRILLSSEPLPLHPWAVTPRVNGHLTRAIRQALLALNDSPEGRRLLRDAGLSGLRPASDRDYDPARKIVAQTLNEHY